MYVLGKWKAKTPFFQNDIDLFKNKLDRFIEACEIGKRAGANEDEQLTNTGRIGPRMQHSIKGTLVCLRSLVSFAHGCEGSH